MPRKNVDVFDRAGAKLFSYSIALEENECLDAEFEEVALIFAESSGLVASEELLHLHARCEIAPALDETVAQAVEPTRKKRQKSTVVSLVKHRMKRAGRGAERHRIRQVS